MCRHMKNKYFFLGNLVNRLKKYIYRQKNKMLVRHSKPMMFSSWKWFSWFKLQKSWIWKKDTCIMPEFDFWKSNHATLNLNQICIILIFEWKFYILTLHFFFFNNKYKIVLLVELNESLESTYICFMKRFVIKRIVKSHLNE